MQGIERLVASALEEYTFDKVSDLTRDQFGTMMSSIFNKVLSSKEFEAAAYSAVNKKTTAERRSYGII